MRSLLAGLTFALLCVGAARADMAAFRAGPLITDFGPVADVQVTAPIPDATEFRIAFDLAKGATPGAINRGLESGARFLNMHASAGVDPARMKLAFVIHGPAVRDVTRDAAYRAAQGADNANAELVAALQAHGVEIYVCGQSAASRGVTSEDLLPGVAMSLSAMTAHALLQQDGYTLNPF